MTGLLRIIPFALFTFVLCCCSVDSLPRGVENTESQKCQEEIKGETAHHNSSGETVPRPVNLSIQALNTNYSLHWDWLGERGQTATFAVHFIGKFQLEKTKNPPKWRTACRETTKKSCDLSPVNLHYLGIHTLRVRATVNGYHSTWACKDFAPCNDAAVGPPIEVLVSSAGHNLEVSVSAPQTNTKTSMKDLVSSLHYRFLYWERNTKPKASSVDSASTVMVLEDLKPWTWYCVSVQSRTIAPNRTSDFTDPVCVSTKGGFQWGTFSWIFGIALFVPLMIVLGILLGVYYRKKSILTRIPHPVFLDQNWDFLPMDLSVDCASEQCDQVTAISSSEKQADSSDGHEWQSSGDSQDSGIYATSNKTTSEQSTDLHEGASCGT